MYNISRLDYFVLVWRSRSHLFGREICFQISVDALLISDGNVNKFIAWVISSDWNAIFLSLFMNGLFDKEIFMQLWEARGKY